MVQDQTMPSESPSERAYRVTEQLRGLLKDEIAEYGGTEGFMRWMRHDEEPASWAVEQATGMTDK